MDRLFIKYLVPLLIFSIIPLLLSSIFLFVLTKRNINTLENELSVEISSTLINEISHKNEAYVAKEGLTIEKEIDRISNTMISMSVSPDFSQMNLDAMNLYIENVINIEPSLLQVSILNRWGEQVYDKLNSLTIASEDFTHLGESEAFKVVEQKQQYFSKVKISENTEEPYLTIGQPILDVGNNFKGAIIFKIDLKNIYTLAAEIEPGMDGTLYILSDEGYLISHPSMKEMLQNPDYSKYDYVKTILIEKNGTIRADQKLISFYTNKYNWTATIELPEGQALAPVEANKQTVLAFIDTSFRSISYTTVIIILFVLIMAVISSILVARVIINPIVDLTIATARVAAGDLDIVMKKRSNDEVGELTDSFNLMSIELRKNRNELLERNEYIKQQAEDLLDRYNRDLEQFAYVTTHDLIEPLRMIASYTQLLERKYQDQFDDDAEEFMGYIVEGVGRMHTIINDLFEYSHIRTDVKDFEEVSFLAVFERVIEKLENEIKEDQTEISCSHLPTTKAVHSNMVQLFQNLIGNAIKFKSPDRILKIKIDFIEKRDNYQFSVADNGMGFEQKYANKVFEIFKRLNRREDYKGSGMGLAICKNVVERHGGKIWVESEQNVGTTFYFTIKKY